MLIKLKKVPVDLKQWFERCPCHEFVITFGGRRRRSRRKQLIADGLVDGTCPLFSCRVQELIDAGIEQVFEDLKQEHLAELVEALEAMKDDGVCAEPLTDADIAEILDDFGRACSHYLLAFGVKFAWTRAFPWIIMVLVPHEKQRGRERERERDRKRERETKGPSIGGKGVVVGSHYRAEVRGTCWALGPSDGQNPEPIWTSTAYVG